jgi:MFS transporter, DHA2 family, methylenomycin A resistance protein
MASRNFAITVATTSLGIVVVRLDGSIVNVALPQIAESFATGMSGLQWVVDGYTLAIAALLLLGGSLCDRLGARRMFIWGFAIFVTASLACAFAPNLAGLIAARAVQGTGAALLMPCSLALLNHACGDDQASRAHAVGLWVAASGVAVTAGPALGGLLVGMIGWQSIFVVNVPIGVIGIWLVCRFVDEVDAAPVQSGLDLTGQCLAIVTLIALTGAVIEAGSLGWSSPFVVSGLVLAGVSGTAFIVTEARSAAPMLPLWLFRSPAFSASVTIGFIVSLTMFGFVFLLALYFQRVLGYSPSATGLAFVPYAVMVTAANLAGGRVAARAGARPTLVAGLVVAAAGYVLLDRIDETTSFLAMLPGQLVIRAGVGLCVPAFTASLLSAAPKARSGVASAVLNMLREAGGTVGVALFGALMAADALAGMRTAIIVSAWLLALAAVLALVGVRSR